MGFDLYGRAPLAEVGTYFRNSVWWWHPLWKYCCTVQPALLEAVRHGHSNDGDGLDAEGARTLAEVLSDALQSGHTAQYAAAYEAELAALPDEVCDLCKGTGERHDQYVAGTCNRCGGKGAVRPSATWYPFSVDNVRAFRDFLEHCGGFQIW
jgi:hypothetical protein